MQDWTTLTDLPSLTHVTLHFEQGIEYAPLPIGRKSTQKLSREWQSLTCSGHTTVDFFVQYPFCAKEGKTEINTTAQARHYHLQGVLCMVLIYVAAALHMVCIAIPSVADVCDLCLQCVSWVALPSCTLACKETTVSWLPRSCMAYRGCALHQPCQRSPPNSVRPEHTHRVLEE